MIPRGLAVAVCIGVVAGAAAGTALYGKGATVPGAPLSYVDGPSLSVDAEKADYRTGEAVRIRVVNTGTVPLEFVAGSHYGVRITQLDGIEVYSPPAGAGVGDDSGHAAPGTAATGPSVLAPRDEAVLVWNQTKNDGGSVLHGTYRITSSAEAGTADDGGGGAVRIEASVAINILK